MEIEIENQTKPTTKPTTKEIKIKRQNKIHHKFSYNIDPYNINTNPTPENFFLGSVMYSNKDRIPKGIENDDSPHQKMIIGHEY